jgi:hypothetical protein
MHKHNKSEFFFQNHGQEVVMFICLWLSKIVVNIFKNNNTLSTHLQTLHSIYHHCFSHITNGWLHIKN